MPDEKPLEMNGSSELIIGMGRVGKTGYCLRKLKKIKSDKKVFVVPRVTHPWLLQYDSIDWPVKNVEDLKHAINNSKTDELVVYYTRLDKKQPSIFEILTDSTFRGLVIYADELAVLLDDPEDWNQFKDHFIRVVGQNNQQFFGASHRIADDIPPVVALNCQRIYLVGQMADDREIDNLYAVSNVKNKMNRDEFTRKCNSQPEKYDWWSDHPNEAAVFQIYG